MASKAKKGKEKKSYSKYEIAKEGKEHDMSRVKCFTATSMEIMALVVHKRRRKRRL